MGSSSTFQVSAMLVLTYFVSATILGISGLYEWYPLLPSIITYVDNGASPAGAMHVLFALAEITLSMFVVLIYKTLRPRPLSQGKLWSPVINVVEYVVAYNLAMLIVHAVFFRPEVAAAIKIGMSIVVLIPAALSAVILLVLGIKSKIGTGTSIKNAFIDFVKGSTVVKLLFSAFSVALVIMFVAIFLELTYGIDNFLGNIMSSGISLFFELLIMLFGVSLLVNAIKQ